VRQAELSATTQKESTGLTSKLAKPNSMKFKNRDIIALSVTCTLSAQQKHKNSNSIENMNALSVTAKLSAFIWKSQIFNRSDELS